MQAVIRSGSKQYLVKPDQVLNIDLVAEGTKNIEFEPLLVIDAAKIQVGTPVVKGVTVKAEVLETVKGEKLQVLKFKAKKRIHKRTGHRQRYSKIKIISIGSGAAKSAASTKKSAVTAK